MPFYLTSRSKQDLPALFGTDTPTSPHPEATRRALAYLHDRGAHFVLLADKKPLWLGYLTRRPALETVLHSPELGIIPWSIQSTALDVDRGQPVQLCLFRPPLVVLESGKVDRCHLYYRDTEPRRNGNWDAFGCSGQIRGANGFLRLWHSQSSVKLLFALVHNPAPCLFPADLILALSVSTWVWSGGGPRHHRTWTPEQRRRGGITRGRMQQFGNLRRDVVVRAMAAQGEKQGVIAAHVGLTQARVSQILKQTPKI